MNVITNQILKCQPPHGSSLYSSRHFYTKLDAFYRIFPQFRSWYFGIIWPFTIRKFDIFIFSTDSVKSTIELFIQNRLFFIFTYVCWQQNDTLYVAEYHLMTNASVRKDYLTWRAIHYSEICFILVEYRFAQYWRIVRVFALSFSFHFNQLFRLLEKSIDSSHISVISVNMIIHLN